MRVEIIGGMGVGKTTLCNILEQLEFNCVFEKLQQNPYLELSYADPESYGFYSQISFILGNFFTVAQNTDPASATIFDYSVITDRAYATMFLQGKAREIALQTMDFLEEKEGRADLMIYLTCSPETQLDRIRSRNRDYESNVDLDFVATLGSYLNFYTEQAENEGAKILVIDTDKVDLRHDTDFISSLSMEIRQYISKSRIDFDLQNILNQSYARENSPATATKYMKSTEAA